MSNSQPSTGNRKFWLIAGLTLALSSALVVSAAPYAGAARSWEARQLVGKAQLASGGEAEADYRLAYRLDPANSDAALHFAVDQTNRGNPDEALAILVRAGEGREVEAARLRAALEAGKPDLAVTAADRLLELKPTESDVVLAAAAYGAAGNPTRAASLAPLVASPEALQAVQRAAGDKLALASVLAASGLQKSSSGLLVKIPNSLAKTLLLARILINQDTPTSLAAAVDYLNSGIVLDPANIELRTQLIAMLRRLGRNDEAAKQQVLLDNLVAGRP